MIKWMRKNDAIIEFMRDEFNEVEFVDPDGPAYKKLRAYLNCMDEDGLSVLADANIKWVSILAKNILRKKDGDDKDER